MSPYYVLIITLAISPAFNSALLFGLYSANLHASDSLYIATILLINIVPCSFLFIKDKHIFKNFFMAIIIAGKKDLLFKYIIALGIIFLVSIAMSLTPYNNDILEYFEIGKVFYKEKTLLYPVLPHYSANLFSSHASHPPFFTLLQSLCFLIQGTTKYHLINNFLHGFYLFLFIIILLTIMQKRIILASAYIVLGIFTSNYIMYVYFYPSGLDIFRLTYFLFTFFVLQQLILKPQSKVLIILLGIFCGLSLLTHSSGLLFIILILPIFLATYPSKNTSSKYYALLIFSFISILIGGWQYLVNLYNYGSPVSDDVLLWSKYGYHLFMRYERDLYNINSMFKKLLELLSLSSSSYGYFYTIFVVFSIFRIKQILYNSKNAFLNVCNLQSVSLAWYMPYFLYILGFYSIVLLSILFNQDLIIKNFRYLVSPYPFVIIIIYALTPSFSILRIQDMLMVSSRIN
ncbi:MAG: hypothetical protein LN588_03675 [Rickettsia endosymbiont of Bryobia graminum]|nr:hypothetical protein [Rickettsia endosymbiont of Bryobia graminum]